MVIASALKAALCQLHVSASVPVTCQCCTQLVVVRVQQTGLDCQEHATYHAAHTFITVYYMPASIATASRQSVHCHT